jgi:hypothetical protein
MKTLITQIARYIHTGPVMATMITQISVALYPNHVIKDLAVPYGDQCAA